MSEENLTITKLKNVCCVPQRFVVTFFGFTACMNGYAMRNSLNAVLTQLIKPRNETSEGDKECERTEIEPHQGVSKAGGEYDWSREMESQVIRTFFLGYIAGHLPAGILADAYGAKWVLNIGVFLSSMFTLLTPILIQIGGAPALIVARVCTGLFQSVLYPSFGALMARWAPLHELSSLGAIVMSGGLFGQSISSLISSYLVAYSKWQMVFYLWGSLGVMWCFFFTIMCFSEPHNHPCIRETELEMFESEFGITKRPHCKKFPWKKIFSSDVVWALICCNVGHDWGLYIMVGNLPIYMRDVLNYAVIQAGLHESIKYFCFWISSVVSGFVADAQIRSGKMTATRVRKVNTLVAHIGPGIFMIAASYSGCHEMFVATFFTISLILMGPYYCGMRLTPIDISPNYAGTLMAISNGFSALCGYFSPMLVRYMTRNATFREWRSVFQLCFAVLCSTVIIFCLWGTAEVQSWNEIEDDDDDEGKKR